MMRIIRYGLVIFFSFFCCIVSVSAQVIDSTQLSHIDEFTSLEEALKTPDLVYKLNLKKKKLTSVPKEIFQFKNLQVLDLSRNKITELPPEIGDFKYLQKLDVAKNKIVKLPMEIGNLCNLRVLVIFENVIEALPKEIGSLQNLEVLDMWGNETASFPEELKQLKKLKILDLRVISINDDEQERLTQLLPNARILFSPNCNCK